MGTIALYSSNKIACDGPYDVMNKAIYLKQFELTYLLQNLVVNLNM